MTTPQKRNGKPDQTQDQTQDQTDDRNQGQEQGQQQKQRQRRDQRMNQRASHQDVEVPTGTSIPPRLLPWPSEDGKPCYLVSNADGGYMSRMADDMEAEQLETGAQVLVKARKVLDDYMSPYGEVRYAAVRLAECLHDALRVAESRGMRLPEPEPEPDALDAVEPDSTDAGTRPTAGGA